MRIDWRGRSYNGPRLQFSNNIIAGWQSTPSAHVLTLREAVRAWLVGQSSIAGIAGSRVYFAVPSQLSAYPCVVVMVPTRAWSHNLAGADGTSIATVEISALGLYESQCIALAEAIRNFADGFQGIQSGVAVLTCLYDDESDPTPVPPPDGSDNFIYQCTVDYRVKHRVPRPTSVTQNYA